MIKQQRDLYLQIWIINKSAKKGDGGISKSYIFSLVFFGADPICERFDDPLDQYILNNYTRFIWKRVDLGSQHSHPFPEYLTTPAHP